jgi:protein involved in polysaccharide export with SLBB domain
VKTAETELARVQGQTTAAIQTLQSSFSDSVEANLIVPGESIEVLVLEDDSFNGVYQVRRGGYIVLPRVGRVYVAGKDVAGAERSVKEALQESQIKDGTVMIERPDGSTTATGPVIYLAGEFSHPGPWRIPPGVAPTVVTTILRSGGVTQSADLTRVRLLRLVGGQPLVEEVNVQAILDGVGLPSDLSLNPGDIIMIPAFANVIYVTGNVVKPGQLKLLPDDELTAYSAILRCGGFSRFANRSKVYLLRDRGNGNKQKIPVSIKNLQNGKTSDVILEPKDIIPSERDHVYGTLISERETLRFKPYTTYEAWTTDLYKGWRQEAHAGVFGPVTENLSLRGDVGYFWGSGARESVLWLLSLRHTPHPRMYHELRYTKRVTQPDEDLKETLAYRLRYSLSRDLSAVLFASRSDYDDVQSSERGALEYKAGIRFTYDLARRTTLRLGTVFTRIENENPAAADVDRWSSRAEILYRYTQTVHARLLYQHLIRDSNLPLDSYEENLVILTLTKYF